MGHFSLWWGVQCSWAGSGRVRSVCNCLVMVLLLCNLGYPLHAVFVEDRAACSQYFFFRFMGQCKERLAFCDECDEKEVPPDQDMFTRIMQADKARVLSDPSVYDLNVVPHWYNRNDRTGRRGYEDDPSQAWQFEPPGNGQIQIEGDYDE